MSPIERLWLVAAPAPELSVRRKLKTNPQEIDILDQLTKLAAQRTVGVLTPEEYETKLADLRARLSIYPRLAVATHTGGAAIRTPLHADPDPA